MNRRRFIESAVTIAAFAHVPVWVRSPHQADLVLRGALVFDGTGAPAREVDVAIEGQRISGIGPNLQARSAQIIDLHGLALAPGFVDIHGHSDQALLIHPQAESKVRQGVTTEVVGQDGSSVGPWTDERYEQIREIIRARFDVDVPFRDLEGFFAWLDERGAALNIASMVGQGTIRESVVGNDDRPATPQEIRRMAAAVKRALNAGACGLSSGLEYTPGAFADTDELIALTSALEGTDLPYASHMRNEDDDVLAALEEAIHIGRMAGVPVEISHLKAQGGRNWWKAPALLETIEAANTDDRWVGFDVYPYVAYSTSLSGLFPVRARDGGTEAFVERLDDEATASDLKAAVLDKIDQLGGWNQVQISKTENDDLAWAKGRRLGDLADERGRDPYALLLKLIKEDKGRTDMVGFGMSEENVAMQLAHPLAAVCSDGGARATYGPLSQDVPHPRTFGAFPRVLGHYVREKSIMPLEEAIHKMTEVPARRVGLVGRGVIRPGAFADLVAFDPDTVADQATFEDPHQYPVGIPHLWVNGQQVLRDQEQTGALPGRSARPV